MKRLPLFVLMLLTVVGQAAEEARRGMVAAVHHLASEAGVEIMRQGGNAVDAAVVTGLVLGVWVLGAGLGWPVFRIMSTADAGQVRRADQRVDDLHKEVLHWARQEIPRDVTTSGQTIEMLTIAQRFERIADMTTNIAEDVIFLVEGRIVRHTPDA